MSAIADYIGSLKKERLGGPVLIHPQIIIGCVIARAHRKAFIKINSNIDKQIKI